MRCVVLYNIYHQNTNFQLVFQGRGFRRAMTQKRQSESIKKVLAPLEDQLRSYYSVASQ